MTVTIKLILLTGVLIIVAATVFADYQWRRWMAARRRDRETHRDQLP
jgi:cell division protein FtsL